MVWTALAACTAAGLYMGIGATKPDNSQDLFADAQTVTSPPSISDTTP